MLRAASGVHLLAIGREPLPVKAGAYTVCLPCRVLLYRPGAPPHEAFGFPAVELFVHRAAASLG